MIVTAAESRWIRERRRKLGLCMRCGKKRDDENRLQCRKCREKDNANHTKQVEREKKIRASKKALGICAANGCSQESVQGRVLCGFHLEHRSELAKERRERLRKAGLCIVCNKETEGGKTLCPVCNAKSIERCRRYRKRKRGEADL